MPQASFIGPPKPTHVSDHPCPSVSDKLQAGVGVGVEVGVGVGVGVRVGVAVGGIGVGAQTFVEQLVQYHCDPPGQEELPL